MTMEHLNHIQIWGGRGDEEVMTRGGGWVHRSPLGSLVYFCMFHIFQKRSLRNKVY